MCKMIEVYNKEDDIKYIKEKIKELEQQRTRLLAKNKIEHLKYVNEQIIKYEEELKYLGE